MSQLHERIHFILVRTQFASNLGSSVRVMKNMGFSKLILVRPECEVGMEARSFAMRGADILDRARFLPSLQDTLAEIPLLIGTTSHATGSAQREIEVRGLAQELLPVVGSSPAGIVFGPEGNGLSRQELHLCQWLVRIPTADEYPVINLAQAVAIVTFELQIADHGSGKTGTLDSQAEAHRVSSLLLRLEDFLRRQHFPKNVSVERLMVRIRRIAARSNLEKEDVDMLHGLLRALERGTKGES